MQLDTTSVSAAHRAVAEVKDMLHRRADHVLGAAIGTAAFGYRSRNRGQVSKGHSVGKLLTRPLYYCVLLLLGHALAAPELMIRHDGVTLLVN